MSLFVANRVAKQEISKRNQTRIRVNKKKINSFRRHKISMGVHWILNEMKMNHVRVWVAGFGLLEINEFYLVSSHLLFPHFFSVFFCYFLSLHFTQFEQMSRRIVFNDKHKRKKRNHVQVRRQCGRKKHSTNPINKLLSRKISFAVVQRQTKNCLRSKTFALCRRLSTRRKNVNRKS